MQCLALLSIVQHGACIGCYIQSRPASIFLIAGCYIACLFCYQFFGCQKGTIYSLIVRKEARSCH